jgi:Flp pilus assembly pilin Flp
MRNIFRTSRTDKLTMKYQLGVTSIEYALIASLIALAIIVGVSATGEANAQNWSFWTSKVIAVMQRALGH